MEAVGSRLGRSSSRYGGATTVFSGPVRKWKKKWVHVSSPPTATFHHNSHSLPNPHNNNNNNNGGSRLLLCRWTPITPPSTAAGDADNSSGNFSDEPPRRKFRYTPIAVLEEKKVVNEKPEYEPSTESDRLTARQTNVSHEKRVNLDMNEILEKETQDSNLSPLHFGLGFQGNNGESSQNSDDQLEKKEGCLVGGP